MSGRTLCWGRLEGYSRDPGFDQNTLRDSGNIKWDTGFEQNTLRDSGNVKRDLDFTKITVPDSGNVKRDTEFDQNTVQDAELRKKTIFGMAMTVSLREAEFS